MIKVKHGTLSSNTVATVTLNVDADFVEVLNRGNADIYFKLDNVPEVEGNDSEIVPAGTALEIERKAAGNTVVKLVSVGTPDYTVRGTKR